jgi:hypothetical protein
MGTWSIYRILIVHNATSGNKMGFFELYPVVVSLMLIL